MKETKNNKYLYIFLAITFGLTWGVASLFVILGDYATKIFGQLTLTNPIVLILLYSPSISGIIVYFMYGRMDGVKGIFMKLIPRKQDLILIPIIIGTIGIFTLTIHYGSILFGIPIPEMTYTVPEMIIQALRNLVEETGLIGGAFGWIGFMLPFFQGKFKNNIKAGLLTGFMFGLFVLPGYVISSFETATSYPFYVAQLMAFTVFISYIFNVTKGNIFFYILAFWLVATGSRLKLYYFIPQVQILQISFFVIAAGILHYVFKKKNIECELQVFPNFIESNI